MDGVLRSVKYRRRHQLLRDVLSPHRRRHLRLALDARFREIISEEISPACLGWHEVAAFVQEHPPRARRAGIDELLRAFMRDDDVCCADDVQRWSCVIRLEEGANAGIEREEARGRDAEFPLRKREDN